MGYIRCINYISDQEHDPRKFDSWAVGITLLELFKQACNPFTFEFIEKYCRSYEDYLRVLEDIDELQAPAQSSIWHLIRGLLTPDPQKRPAPEEALGYPCFKQKIPQAVQSYLKELVEHQRRSSFAKNMLDNSIHQFMLKSFSNVGKYTNQTLSQPTFRRLSMLFK